jgi:GTP cyclohydrolase I
MGEERMNAIIHLPNCCDVPASPSPAERPNQAEAEAAFATMLRFIGEDLGRDGLRDTPARVVRAFREYFAGYELDPAVILEKTFEETDGYDEMVVLRAIPFLSHCEHHVAPIIGRAWVAYVPKQRVVGISKLARVVDAFARRLQIQERLTAQIANTIQDVLEPEGVAVVVKATHHCMMARGIKKQGADLVTSRMLGCFRDNPMSRQEFLSLVNAPDPTG